MYDEREKKFKGVCHLSSPWHNDDVEAGSVSVCLIHHEVSNTRLHSEEKVFPAIGMTEP